MKTLKIKLRIITALILITGFYACNQNMNDKEDSKGKIEKNIEDVKNDLQLEQEELQKEVNEAIADFDKKMDSYRNKIGTLNKEMIEKNEEIIKNLVAQRATLERELKEMQNTSGEKWESFKKKIKLQSEKFKSDVKDFFTSEDE